MPGTILVFKILFSSYVQIWSKTVSSWGQSMAGPRPSGQSVTFPILSKISLVLSENISVYKKFVVKNVLLIGAPISSLINILLNYIAYNNLLLTYRLIPI